MPPTWYTLEDVTQGIHDALVDALDAARVEDGPLDGILTVVRADRARPLPDMPAIWVFPSIGRNVVAGSQSSGLNLRGSLGSAIRETWEFDWELVSMVTADEPETGLWTASKWAARAQDVVLAARDAPPRPLALPFVSDVRSRDFDPTHELEQDRRQVYWARAGITIVATFLRGAEPA